MATEFMLRRADGDNFGTFDEVKRLIRRYFPNAEFSWTTNGLEKIEQARKHGIEMPAAFLPALENLPSLLEGVATGDDFHVTFGLGHEEPVCCIFTTARGLDPSLQSGLAALEKFAGAEFQISASE